VRLLLLLITAYFVKEKRKPVVKVIAHFVAFCWNNIITQFPQLNRFLNFFIFKLEPKAFSWITIRRPYSALGEYKRIGAKAKSPGCTMGGKNYLSLLTEVSGLLHHL